MLSQTPCRLRLWRPGSSQTSWRPNRRPLVAGRLLCVPCLIVGKAIATEGRWIDGIMPLYAAPIAVGRCCIWYFTFLTLGLPNKSTAVPPSFWTFVEAFVQQEALWRFFSWHWRCRDVLFPSFLAFAAAAGTEQTLKFCFLFGIDFSLVVVVLVLLSSTSEKTLELNKVARFFWWNSHSSSSDGGWLLALILNCLDVRREDYEFNLQWNNKFLEIISLTS